jgi:predicted transcriptional regulator
MPKTRSDEVAVPDDLLRQVRKVVPKRALTFGESINVARVQAARLRQALGVDGTAMPLGWVEQVPNLRIDLLPAHQLGEGTSGLTTRAKDGDYVIAVNKNNSHSHRRFTLAHEIKHLLDYPYAETLHERLGHGNRELRERSVERICDHFAAYLLMPSMLVKRAWTTGFQELSVLAGLFQVSEEAMHIRLTNLGLVGDERRPVATYFRRPGLALRGLATT